VIDQAVGVLIGRGDTPEQAYRHLDLLATNSGVERLTAAEAILAELDSPSATGLGGADGRPAGMPGSGGKMTAVERPRVP
jgi:hypothetical protein